MNRAELEICLEAGFIDLNVKQDEQYLPKILTNDSKKQVKVLQNIITELNKCDEFFFSVAFITNTGIACIDDALKDLETRQIKGKILASQYLNFTEPNALRKLLKFKNLEIRMITENANFHAKGYLFHRAATTDEPDNFTMIIGSSNLTQSALTVNREWNVQLTSFKDGALIQQLQQEFEEAWQNAECVTEEWINAYEKIYQPASSIREQSHHEIIVLDKVNPNKMQVEALQSLENLRAEGKDKALLISATGTGKTFLSAFDVNKYQPQKFLFLVHRELITRAAKASFARILDPHTNMGLYTGNTRTNAAYLFATVQTLTKDEHLHKFSPNYFDYIVIDEVHKAGAASYKKILDYFKPNFLLGMTATPERADGEDIFKIFDHNIAYEIRLHQALAENMLVPFHYHGVTEIEINGELLSDNANFNDLVCKERVEKILQYSDFYGSDGKRVKALIFCSRIEEARELASMFNERGRKSIALGAANDEDERERAIEMLESDSDERNDQLDYIFTVDIFNEGVDIPAVNQIIMLRPTQSAIIFVQQMGRGLRKAPHKRYLEIIDFIGNYKNNFLLPIALFGDRSYKRDQVRRIMHINNLPGASTVHFEDVAEKRIFSSINGPAIESLKEYKQSYQLLKYKLGRAPLMMDFVNLGDKDPIIFVEKKKSYFEFKQDVDPALSSLTEKHVQLLRFLNWEICNGKRLEEVIILRLLLEKEQISFASVLTELAAKSVPSNKNAINGAINLLTLKFFSNADVKKYGSLPLINRSNSQLSLTQDFRALLVNPEFTSYVNDALTYAEYKFLENFDKDKYEHGFKLYEAYTRKDVLRILNWARNESSVVYGYKIKYGTCPIFVTYKKDNDITASTKYEDRFIDNKTFSWMTRNRVTLESIEVNEIRKPETLKLLFVKKSDNEGSEFYYLGNLSDKEAILTTITDDNQRKLSVVNFLFVLHHPLPDKLYSYLEA